MGRRKWTADEKIGIVLQGLRGEVNVSQLCRDHGISQVQYYKWRDQFLKGAKEGLSGKDSQNRGTDKVKIKELERIIGCQTVAIEALKKNLTGG
ncbi:transposase [candidate division KSB1 bacterium]